MPSDDSIRSITADDFSTLAALGLDQPVAMRAMAQDMGWVLADGETVLGAATAYLADGTVFLDRVLGDESTQLTLIEHALSYARCSYAPALTVLAGKNSAALHDRGFVGIDPDGLPPNLRAAAGGNKVLMRRL
ncbi:MAG: hypothetical protein RIC24_08460 [Hyphomicrobiales bacterium]